MATLPKDWQSIQGRTGSSGQVPFYLMALVNTRGATLDEQDRNRAEAYAFLLDQLYDEGKWFPVGPMAAEELVEIVKSDRPGRWRALRLLGDIMTGNHVWWLSQGFGKTRAVGKLEAQARQCAAGLAESALSLLTDPDPTLRSAGAFFLACLGGPNPAAVKVLARQVDAESVDVVLASQILALGILEAGRKKCSANLEAFLDAKSQGALVVGAAALASLLVGTRSPKQLGARLCSISRRVSEPQLLDPSFCWGVPNPEVLEDAVVRGLGPKALTDATDVLLEEIADAPPAVAEIYQKRLLTYGGFTDRWEHAEVVLPEELSEKQREIARRLGKSGPLGGTAHGLPRHRRLLGRWLGDEPPGILEERLEVSVKGKKQKLPRWWIWRNLTLCRMSESDIDGFVLAMDPYQQLELIVDCNSDGYPSMSASSLMLPRAVELVEQVEGSRSEWARNWARRLMLVPTRATDAGPLSMLPSDARYAVMRALQRTNVKPDKDWVVLTPFFKPHVRVVLEKMPLDMREEGTYRHLVPPRLGDLRNQVPMLDLYPSRRIVEALLEASHPNVFGGSPLMDDATRAVFKKKLAEITKTNPEVATWVKEWPRKWQAHLEAYWRKELSSHPWSVAEGLCDHLKEPWCTRDMIERLLELSVDLDAHPADRKNLEKLLVPRIPEASQKRPIIGKWVAEWKAGQKGIARGDSDPKPKESKALSNAASVKRAVAKKAPRKKVAATKPPAKKPPAKKPPARQKGSRQK